MDNVDRETLVSVLREVLHEHRTIDDETHRTDHEFIKFLKEREERKIARWEKVRQQVYGWGIIMAIGSIGTAVYQFFIKGNGHS